MKNMNKSKEYKEIFDELKETVTKAGLLKRVPIRGSVEMIAVLVSFVFVYVTITHWNPILLGLFMTLLFTRAVFVSHDILHLQYFKSKKLSLLLSYPFSAITITNSSSWWIFKHNINHHNNCNVPEKDEDILAMDGAFTPNHKGNNSTLRFFKYLVFWGAMFFMYPAFIVQSYNYAIKKRKFLELTLMLLHWPIVWGFVFYSLSLESALITFVTLYLSLSLWLSFGFITNHLACEVFNEKQMKELSWLEFQMRTSRSLKGGFIIHWFYGGLNTQIEHHLFPHAPRFNLLEVQRMTKKFAKKYNIKYFETTPIEAYIQINKALSKY